ncbi:MAG: HAD-IB family hydrolase [Gammaproteobacteria bacterium]|nr:HAD-IB family hydrolase [Gammaproteobacteria bacterium]
MNNMQQRLALFDLDNTLLDGDSDHAWGEFLIDRGLVDKKIHRARNDQFYRDYLDENLDIFAYVAFTLEPILRYTNEQRKSLCKDFMKYSINSMILNKARNLIDKHKSQGDLCIIITATNSFITKPIANAFKIDNLIATEVETAEEYLTGKILGTPCYQDGKVVKLKQWLASQSDNLSIANSVFYSDSVNDLALLEAVKEPIAVDPDRKLLQISRDRNWQILSLRE